MTLEQIIQALKNRQLEVGLSSLDNLDKPVSQVASLESAEADQITFFNDPRIKPHLNAVRAGAILVKQKWAEIPKETVQLVVNDPYYAYAITAQLLNPPPEIKPGIHPSAQVIGGAQIDETSEIAAFVTVSQDAEIGAHCYIGEGSYIGSNVKIGEGTRIAPNVVIMHDCLIGESVLIESGARIGGDGFGWAPHAGKWEKIPQIGRVVIGDRVSIGNNTCIDRGALKDTVIGDDCIIDNLVHIAHNVEIGAGSAIAGQVGFAGSTTVGQHTIAAGQVGFAGHLSITDGCQFMAKSGVTHNIKTPGSYSGFPAIPTAQWQKTVVRTRQLDKMAQQIKNLQKQLSALQAENQAK